jgi:hypothetical protein
MKITYSKLLPSHAKQYRELRLESLKLYPEFFGSSFEEQNKLPELRLEDIRVTKPTKTLLFLAGSRPPPKPSKTSDIPRLLLQ